MSNDEPEGDGVGVVPKRKRPAAPIRYYRARRKRLRELHLRRKLVNRSQKLLCTALRMLPILRDTVFFESHRGLSYSCNPKAICEELLRRNSPVNIVWSFQDPSIEVPPGVRKVRKGSVAYYQMHSRAAVLVHNGEFGQALPIRKDQVYINTQHGTPLKLMGTDILQKKPQFSSSTYSRTGRWTVLVSPNEYATDIFKRVYEYDGPVLQVGYPRNDVFHKQNTPEGVAQVRRNMGIPLDKKVLLYAPTWRDIGVSMVDNRFRLQLDIDRLRAALGPEVCIVLRLHHLISKSISLTEEQHDFVLDRSNGKYDAQDLMLAADVLITDYSSMMFDYANLGRPTVFYAYDLSAYSDDIRGMYFDLREHAPGPVVETMDDLVDTLIHLDERLPAFEEKRRAFQRKFCSLENGTASQRVVDEVILPALGRSPVR